MIGLGKSSNRSLRTRKYVKPIAKKNENRKTRQIRGMKNEIICADESVVFDD